MVKPDGVHRGLVGTTIERFEKKGFKLVGLKLVRPTRALVEQIASCPLFAARGDSPSSGGGGGGGGGGVVVVMVWEAAEAVTSALLTLGRDTNTDMSAVCEDLCIQDGRNIVVASVSVEAARKEIAVWFTEEELVGWTLANENWLNKRNE